MNKRFVHLEPQEIATLEEAYKNVAHHQVKQRAHALLLSHKGNDMATLTAIFSVSLATISNRNGGPVVHRLADQRHCGLAKQAWTRPKSHSEKRRLAPHQSESTAASPASQSGSSRFEAGIATPVLRQNAAPFFKKHGRASWRRGRKCLKAKQDPIAYADKAECLRELDELAKAGHIDLFFGDEAGFSLGATPAYGWQFPGEPIRILPQAGQRVNVLGFLKSSGDELSVFEPTGSARADFVVASIEQWRQGLSKPTVLVLDNARIHRSHLMINKLAEWQVQGLYVFFLPTYSPHLNRIERLWLKVKQRWLNPSAYASLESLRSALEQIWQQFGTVYQVNFK